MMSSHIIVLLLPLLLSQDWYCPMDRSIRALVLVHVSSGRTGPDQLPNSFDSCYFIHLEDEIDDILASPSCLAGLNATSRYDLSFFALVGDRAELWWNLIFGTLAIVTMIEVVGGYVFAAS